MEGKFFLEVLDSFENTLYLHQPQAERLVQVQNMYPITSLYWFSCLYVLHLFFAKIHEWDILSKWFLAFQ